MITKTNSWSTFLLTNEAIVKLINEDVALEDAGSLIYTQVFPYEFIPENS